jgi:Exonuclease
MSDDFGLVCDWETSGLLETHFPYETFLEGPQGIEIGAIMVKLPEFIVLEEYESKVRFLGTHDNISYGGPLYEKLTWSSESQEIHGITIESLKNAPSPTEVAANLMYMTQKYVKSNDPIMFSGHSPIGDIYHTKQLLFLGGRSRGIRFHHRMFDTFSLGKFLYGAKSSSALFKIVSGVVRGKHTAIEDARLTLAALQRMYIDVKYCHDHGYLTKNKL